MNWIDIKESRPVHHETVLALSPKGYCVVVFVDSEKMNDELMRSPYAHECVDISKRPYFFASQEIKGNTMNEVTHWMSLPERPDSEVKTTGKRVMEKYGVSIKNLAER